MELNDEQIQQVLQGISIPPQPQVLVDLQMEQLQPEPDLNRISRLISQDVGLSGTMLKTVNSSFFNLSNNITSVNQAVNLLGFNSVINIVNGISIKGELADEDIIELNRFWDTTQDVANICAYVSRQIGYQKPDNAYVLGLFHNTGIPLMHKRFQGYFNAMKQSYDGSLSRIIDYENQTFRTNHAVIGYYVAKAWRLPEIVCMAIAEHHNMESLLLSSKRSEMLTLLSALKIAEHMVGLYRKLGMQEYDFEWDKISQDLLAYVGLGSYDLETMAESFRDQGLDIDERF